MDALKNLANKASSGGSSTTNTNTNTNAAAGGAQQEDYGDKGKHNFFSSSLSITPVLIEKLKLTSLPPFVAFDMLAKKSGHSVDRNTSEKITDGARQAYEKATGKTVNPKISN